MKKLSGFLPKDTETKSRRFNLKATLSKQLGYQIDFHAISASAKSLIRAKLAGTYLVGEIRG